MNKNDIKYTSYVQILKEELVPAMGCTEPIALAYGAAKAREVLGTMPDKVVIGASGSIIKNVKSVIVPNTDHLKGIPAAATAGIVAGKAEKDRHQNGRDHHQQIHQQKRGHHTVADEVVLPADARPDFRRFYFSFYGHDPSPPLRKYRDRQTPDACVPIPYSRPRCISAPSCGHWRCCCTA